MEDCFDNNTMQGGAITNLSSYFTDTVSATLLITYIVIAGGVMKQKEGSNQTASKERESVFPPHLSTFQGVMTVLLSSLALIRFLLHLVAHENNCQDVTSLYLQTFLWPISLAIIWLEGRKIIQTTATAFHLTLAAFWTLSLINENLKLITLGSKEWKLTTSQRFTDKLNVIVFALRYLFILMLFLMGLKTTLFGVDDPQIKKSLSTEEKEEDTADTPTPLFHNFFGKLKMFLPFIWPKGSRRLQFYVFVCVLIMVFGRYLMVLRPLCYKQLIDSLTNSSNVQISTFRWELVIGYIGIDFLDEFLENVRYSLWEQVDDFTVKDVEVQLFSHIHKLSLGWHLSRKTGEVLETTSRGTSSAASLLRYLVFTIFPSFADLCIALIYFMTAFNVWFAIILLITMILYSVITYTISDWLAKVNKEPIKLYTLLQSIRVDSLLNFETVKCFSTEDYEVSRYRKCLFECQGASWKQSLAYNCLHLAQKFVTTGGLMAGSFLCVMLIINKQDMTMGDYVLFVAYTNKVYSPMYTFGGVYSYMQQCFLKTEKMFDILNAEEDVKDDPQAPDLIVRKGRIEFKNVSFSYLPERPILKNISFVVHPGQTVAFVGPTGSGKSTIARLLFRLYDIKEGMISIDNQNIEKVTQKSVRRSIGSVPQDTVLFNTDIRFNIRYGNLDASDEDVQKAAITAEIHNAILGFPKGYNTKVGERGLKLSGGEKQRIAIARTILKSAPITLLDEATSSLDTQTERSIQSSLNRLCACKTTVIIAHRLSTIIHAHQINVLKDGQIVETGTHEELLGLDGEYKRMWQSQLKELTDTKVIDTETKEEFGNDIVGTRQSARLNPMD